MGIVLQQGDNLTGCQEGDILVVVVPYQLFGFLHIDVRIIEESHFELHLQDAFYSYVDLCFRYQSLLGCIH